MKVGIVGAGIVGLSHAWHFQKAGHQVTLFEREAFAQGATVRNFGMIWPVGQPPGEIRALALRSRAIWEQVSKEAELDFRPCGSLHLAYHPLEWQVLKEFAEASQDDAGLLTPQRALAKCPSIKPEDLQGAYWSPHEAMVDPRKTAQGLSGYLEKHHVTIRWNTPISSVGPRKVVDAEGKTHNFDWVIVCAGPWVRHLNPAGFDQSEMTLCRLQMLRLRPKTDQRLGVHLAAGLTQTHYANFRPCPSLTAVRQSLAERWPKQVERGIHVLVSEHLDGCITVGDSHEYGQSFMPYRDESVDEAILQALNQFLEVSNYTVVERWVGEYPTHATLPYFSETPEQGLTFVNTFGTGMTLSFGVAEQTFCQLMRDQNLTFTLS